MPSGKDGNPEDTLKILIATDNHIGYMEKDGCRKDDSMKTFEEVLKIGKDHNVDFVLLGGDLFHDNKPSHTSLHGSIELFRKYCHGDKPCSVAFLSDPKVNFGHTPFKMVNYQDPNINVSMPIFSIHGNHDDPAGPTSFCPLDMLHSAGLVNYFGKVSSLDNISISPLLLQKGKTKLALYGLGNVRDERLNRMFGMLKVNFLRPTKDTEDWFNILVLHQNRAKHGAKNHIPEEYLDDFLDLIVWGHEHECKVDLSWNGTQNFYITQPGSSIATSLSEGETKMKHVGILQICGKDFKLDKVRLKTVRQFYMEDIVLQDVGIKPGQPKTAANVEQYCSEVVEKYLSIAESERQDTPEAPDRPLIRLRIDYSTNENEFPYEIFSIPRFGQKFSSRVANPREMVVFHRKRAYVKKESEGEEGIEVRLEGTANIQMEDMIKEFFKHADKRHRLKLLTDDAISDAMNEYVFKEEKESIGSLVKHQLNMAQNQLKLRNTKEDEVEEELEKIKTKISEDWKKMDVGAKYNGEKSKGDKSESDIEELVGEEAQKPAGRGRGRGRGKGRGSKGASNITTSRRKKTKADDSEEDDDLNKTTKSKKSTTGKNKRLRNIEEDEEENDDRDNRSIASSTKVKKSQKKSAKKNLLDDISDDDDDVHDKVSNFWSQWMKRGQK